MIRFLSSLSQTWRTVIISILGLLLAVIVSVLTFASPIAPMILIVGALAVVYIIFLFQDPAIGLTALTVYCFLFGILAREVGGLAYGIGIELFLLLIWIAVIILNKRYDWKILNNTLTKLMLAWFIISVVEIINPAGASVRGWLQEIRSTGLFPILVIPLVFLLYNSKQKLNLFLILVLSLSLLATINGLKQQFIGLSAGEEQFLKDGGEITHVLWGRLRVFSFYSDAGQFGASQASFALLAMVLAVGPYKWWKRLILLIIAGLSFYGMLISGTRGALFALVVGAFFAIFLTKNIKVLIIGGTLALMALFFLKYTYIGNGNYQIYRLRTALDPQEASLNVRFNNQKIIGQYLESRPFGGGLGVIGTWGKEYNKDKFLSTVEPDSYWVKLWAMYGIVGFTVWFCMILYIFGKCCGIIWKIRNEGLRYKAIAMMSTCAGIFFCSYGNEVMNSQPSSLVVSVFLAFIFLCPNFDDKPES
ncbi:O-antigen ligase domain-containing protein [Pedobacter sp. LMG 31462]|uniref:O-antigen ligase domain-containing protein n=2 Tax=Pedobacter gandavensis TaxID=2679963 RepID=A0ABR6EVD9_9SPHI|nr:O-antigen ligase domain-containing protein [Pedobacter gandavensis]